MNEPKAVAALLAVLALTCFVPKTAAASDFSRAGAVVVRASGPSVDGIGAGTIVARAGNTVRVITAKHVATFGALTLRFLGGRSAPAHIVDLIAGRDIAIIEADVPRELAATVRPAPVRPPQSNGLVHVWGSGHDGPALEPAAIRAVGAELPDGPARGRYALTCNLCHEGDSGGGVFDRAGNLVGIFVGYFTVAAERISVAETPDDAVRTACERPFAALTVATSTRSRPVSHVALATMAVHATNRGRTTLSEAIGLSR